MHEICSHSRKSQAQVVGLEVAHEVRNVAEVVVPDGKKPGEVDILK